MVSKRKESISSTGLSKFPYISHGSQTGGLGVKSLWAFKQPYISRRFSTPNIYINKTGKCPFFCRLISLCRAL